MPWVLALATIALGCAITVEAVLIGAWALAVAGLLLPALALLEWKFLRDDPELSAREAADRLFVAVPVLLLLAAMLIGR